MKHLIAVVVVAAFGSMQAQESPILVSPSDIQWKDGPPSLPPGAKAAVIQGDPSKEGPFTIRLKLPADYKIPPHFHPDTETVTVLSGTFNVSMGDTFDASKGKSLGAGSFAALPKKSPHFAFTKEPTEIQVNAHGPWSLNYVNPADDPRNNKK
jgi:quercetin dioxygenase-like cupin family protein